MLFNSGIFIFAFLPLTLFAYFGLGRYVGLRAACGAPVVASLFYYGWWNPKYLLLLVPATLANAALGYALCRSSGETFYRRLLLWAGVMANLALLGYFKYAGFFAANVNAALGEAMVQAMLGAPAELRPVNFGRLIEPATVEAEILAFRAERDAWTTRNPAVIERYRAAGRRGAK